MSDAENGIDIAQMKRDWDDRARENAKWFIKLAKWDQTEEEFFATGELEVESTITSDPVFREGRDLSELRLLEIGCGIGRMTRYLSAHFAEVHGIDVSGEMIARARENLHDLPNVTFTETNGIDVSPLPDNYFDRAFSVYVFQHIPSLEVVRSNIRDILRVLRPGGLFKFQVNAFSDAEFDAMPKNTWTGVAFSELDIRNVARDFGAHLVSIVAPGTLSCWAILRKANLTVEFHRRAPQIEQVAGSMASTSAEVPQVNLGSYLTLTLSGVDPARLDANEVVAEVSDRATIASYAGYTSDDLRDADQRPLAGSNRAEVRFLIPRDFPAGEQPVRVRVSESPASTSVAVNFLVPAPTPPRIYYASNVVDGGTDIHAHGPKSRFRVFVEFLPREISREAVSLLIDERRLAIDEMIYIPAGGYQEVIAQLPADITTGEHELVVASNALRSLPVTLDILA